MVSPQARFSVIDDKLSGLTFKQAIKKGGGHACGTHWTKTYTDFWLETLEERDRFEDPGADRITVFNRILQKSMKRCRLDTSGRRYGPVASPDK
jgi:hypothetical protein